MKTARLFALLLCLAAVAACGDDEPTTPTQPTPRPEISEEFAGTLSINGGRSHPFNTTGSGLITLTVAELTPDSTAAIGVSLGTWNGTTCQVILARDEATQATQVVGNAGAAGSYCARIYDAGNLRATTGYKLTVVHF